jgi:hypothetical protein
MNKVQFLTLHYPATNERINMPKIAKYALIAVFAIWVLRNPDAAAGSLSGLLNALFKFIDKVTTSKA